MLWLMLVAQPAPALLQDMVAETALLQAAQPSDDWQPAQRDCAGLVRYSYRSAYKKLEPQRLEQGLWRDRAGKPTAFADAETLVQQSFVWLGRDPALRYQIRSGDILAYRQDRDEAPVYHLMLVVRQERQADTLVVYHPGDRSDRVRVGSLAELLREAPLEWRPVPENSAFLGFYRFREWLDE